jgi:hypothetical protein
LILGISGRGLIAIGLSAVFCSVRVVFLVIFGSEAVEGASFCSQIVFGTGVRLDLRKLMLEDRQSIDVHFPPLRNYAKPRKSWRANRAQIHPRVG